MEGNDKIVTPKSSLVDQARVNLVEQFPYFTYEELQTIIDEVSIEIYRIPVKDRIEGEQTLVMSLLGKLLQQKRKFKSVFTSENGSTYFVLDSGESFRIKKQNPIANWQGEYAMQPVSKRIFFVDPQEWGKLELIIKQGRRKQNGKVDVGFNARKKIYEQLTGKDVSEDDYYQQELLHREGIQRLTGEPILTTSLKPGVIPLEFDRVKWGEATLFKIEGDKIIILGHTTMTTDNKEHIWPDGPGAGHYGHPVLEIIKR